MNYRGKWFTDGVRDVKAKECPPGFRPGRSTAFKKKEVIHEEKVQQSQPPAEPVAEHQVQAEGHSTEEVRVQETAEPQTGEGWFRP